jgi:endonuclease/exonuclease/phosphatase family metal-dependent hydrolase
MKTLFLALCLSGSLLAQPVYTLMSYNLLNYPGTDTTTRNPYFRTIFSSVEPDILVVQEVISQAGIDGFLNNVLNAAGSGYAAGTFINGPDTDNGIFYKTENFTFLVNNRIPTTLRDINEFLLRENSTGDTLRIYSVHLKASSGATNEQQRLAEVSVLRNITDTLHSGSYYIICGDFNIYSSNEPAYQKLKNQSTSGYVVDILNLTGVWNNSAYAQYHTQSPRTRQFGGGATGGMDDRFDMILMSRSIIDLGGITYQNNSYIAYGNDGLHYNDSINRPPNNAVGQVIVDALHYSSDHLPVMASFRFEEKIPVELQSFTASADNNNILLKWSTVTETNNLGFEIERWSEDWRLIGFVKGSGSTTYRVSYEFNDIELSPGSYSYRLKQIDYDGSSTYSYQVQAEISHKYEYNLNQNFPNPFNNNSVITFSIPHHSQVILKITDVLGNEIETLLNEEKPAGSYKLILDAAGLSSGIYFYRLQAGGYIETKKMILIR